MAFSEHIRTANRETDRHPIRCEAQRPVIELLPEHYAQAQRRFTQLHAKHNAAFLTRRPLVVRSKPRRSAYIRREIALRGMENADYLLDHAIYMYGVNGKVRNLRLAYKEYAAHMRLQQLT